MKKTLIAPILAGVLALALAGCSTGGAGDSTTSAEPTTSASASKTVEPSASTSATPTAQVAGHTKAQLDEILSGTGFDPAKYANTSAMVDGIYPGLSSTSACLEPFGVGWENAESSATAWGPSVDQTMTAVLTSTGAEATAEALMNKLAGAIAECTATPGTYTLQGAPVTLTTTTVPAALNGVDAASGWKATAQIGGQSTTLVAMTARIGGDVVMIVGWDPQTNDQYVPAAMQMLVSKLAAN